MSLHAALSYLEQGAWEKAHTIAQADDSRLGAWLHAIVHVQEGDHENARYWYQQARRPFSKDIPGELRALRAALELPKP
jgi:Tfp pilus assembly protein PilF